MAAHLSRYERTSARGEVKKLAIEDQLKHTLEEARIILPGIQALFGFQLVAVYDSRFSSALLLSEQRLHLFATALTAIAMGFALAPTAVHRQAEPYQVSEGLIRITSWCLTASLIPIVISISLDFYLLCRMIVHDLALSFVISGALFAILVFLWFVFPLGYRLICRGSRS